MGKTHAAHVPVVPINKDGENRPQQDSERRTGGGLDAPQELCRRLIY